MADEQAPKLRAVIQKMIDEGQDEGAIREVVRQAKARSVGAQPVSADEPSTWWGGFMKALMPGGKAYSDSGEAGKHAQGAAEGFIPGVAQGVQAIPAMVVDLLKAGLIGTQEVLSIAKDPSKAAGIFDKAKKFLGERQDNPLAPLLDKATKMAMEQPEEFGQAMGNIAGQAGVAMALPGLVNKAKPGLATAGRMLESAADKAPSIQQSLDNIAAGRKAIRAPISMAVKPTFKIGGRALQAVAGELPVMEEATAAAEAPKPFQTPSGAQHAAKLEAGYEPIYKELPNGQKRLVSYRPPGPSVREKLLAAQRAEDAAAAQAAPAAPISPDADAAAAARDEYAAGEQSRVMGSRFQDLGTHAMDPASVPAEIRDRVFGEADNPEWFQGPVQQIAPKAGSYEQMMAETNVPEDFGVAEEGPAYNQDKPSSVGEMPKGSAKHKMGAEMPASRSTKGRSEMFPHLSPNDEDILLNNPGISPEDFLKEREMRNRLYRSGDLGGAEQ
jgi:hypothetical protein